MTYLRFYNRFIRNYGTVNKSFISDKRNQKYQNKHLFKNKIKITTQPVENFDFVRKNNPHKKFPYLPGIYFAYIK